MRSNRFNLYSLTAWNVVLMMIPNEPMDNVAALNLSGFESVSLNSMISPDAVNNDIFLTVDAIFPISIPVPCVPVLYAPIKFWTRDVRKFSIVHVVC